MIDFLEEHWPLIVVGIAFLFVVTLAITRSAGEYDKSIGAK